jgi:hypothetical protein
MNRPSDSEAERLELIYNALSQAQDCITDEPPEGMTYQEARRDTVDKIREAMRTVEAMQSSPAPPSVLKQERVIPMSNNEFDWTVILPEAERQKVLADRKAFFDSFPTKEELEQAGREGREAFAKACAEVDTVREAQADDTPDSIF